ncbi:MAG: hypothetical protein B7Y39_16965 [Bdellovibrio sp. 28-41-41]|nr:MAG: hypothetical protein B7Y39_16965 [Bdellovibrio sp. 28-41-41]
MPLFVSAKVVRKPMSDTAPIKQVNGTTAKTFVGAENAIKKLDVDVLKAAEVTQDQNSFFAAMSYSLFSPTFDSTALKSQNQESLGVSAMIGYSYAPYSGWGMQASLGILQNSKTDRSLPDFVLLKPALGIIFALTKTLYVAGGVFNYTQQGETIKNFKSYFGQEVFVGYKANRKINIKFGFSYSKFSGDFDTGTEKINSIVSFRGLESQLVYLF